MCFYTICLAIAEKVVRRRLEEEKKKNEKEKREKQETQNNAADPQKSPRNGLGPA